MNDVASQCALQEVLDPELRLLSGPTTSSLQKIYRERMRQDEKWGGPQDHEDSAWLAILMEEVGEVAHDIQGVRGCTPCAMAEVELMQVAAVCIAWLECIERRRKGAKS